MVAPLQEIDLSRADNQAGMAWVGLWDINLSGVALVESKKKSQPNYGVCNLVNIMKPES